MVTRKSVMRRVVRVVCAAAARKRDNGLRVRSRLESCSASDEEPAQTPKGAFCAEAARKARRARIFRRECTKTYMTEKNRKPDNELRICPVWKAVPRQTRSLRKRRKECTRTYTTEACVKATKYHARNAFQTIGGVVCAAPQSAPLSRSRARNRAARKPPSSAL